MLPEAGLVVEAWNDFDRVIGGIDHDAAVLNPAGQSSIAWTLAHVTEHVDRMINHAVLGRDRHPMLGVDNFRMGGDGTAIAWDEIRAAAGEVRRPVREYLETLTTTDLEHRFETGGAITSRLGPVTVRYILFRIAAHHYFHTGVVCCQRDLRGDSAGDYPGGMRACNP